MPPSPEKLDLRSLDVAADKRRLLHQLFPEVFTESTGADGNPAELDFEKLKAVLGEHVDLATPGQERYGLEWPGKRDALKAVQAPSLATLIPAPEESVDWETTQNVFIEGDNLEVLKLLQKSYYGKVKMIYIDPPYNTGNDFVYPDNYAESLDTYLRYTGKIDDQGFKTTTNSKDSGRFHSNWLRMMYPRLYVAKNLLREDGVIFISIDDNEAENLKLLCSEVFGSENFVGCFVWQKRISPDGDEKHVTATHDYVLAFMKSKEVFSIKGFDRTSDQDERYANPDNDARGDWTSSDLTRREYREHDFYEIELPSGRKVTPAAGRSWSVPPESFAKLRADNRVWFGPNGDAMPRRKRFLTEVSQRIVPVTWLPKSLAGDNQGGKTSFKGLFPEIMNIFENPKPIELVQAFINMTLNSGDLLVDFFAGTGTTAHACFSSAYESGLVKKDLRFVLVQLPEPTDLAAFPTIAELAKERIRRAGAKIREEHEAKLKAAASEADLLTPQTSKDNPPTTLDTGFRVFKLAPSNFKRWDGEAAATSKEALVQQMEATLDHIAAEATEDSLLFEILLKAGYQLTCPLEKLTLAGRTVWSVDGGSLFVCVENRIDSALVDAVAEKHPVQFICLDRALQGSDSLKVNTLETFRSAQPEIQFRTV